MIHILEFLILKILKSLIDLIIEDDLIPLSLLFCLSNELKATFKTFSFLSIILIHEINFSTLSMFYQRLF